MVSTLRCGARVKMTITHRHGVWYSLKGLDYRLQGGRQGGGGARCLWRSPSCLQQGGASLPIRDGNLQERSGMRGTDTFIPRFVA